MNAQNLLVAAALGDYRVPTRPAVCPPGGPDDVRVYVSLAEIDRADRGAVTPDGRVVVVCTAEERVTELNLNVLDQLESLGWVEYPDERSVRLTDRGRYWLAKFGKANRFRPGRSLFGERSVSR